MAINGINDRQKNLLRRLLQCRPSVDHALKIG